MPPKYRIWSVDHRLMLEVYNLFWHSDGRVSFKAEVVVKGKHALVDGKRIDVYGYLGEKFILMESSHFLDNQPDPVEIYKDDIVEYRFPYDRRVKALGVIMWREDKACFAIRNINGLGTEEVELYRLTANKHLKVVGNIHENPDLLT